MTVVAEVTHIEIRRVQNGFVVMAVDYRPNYSHDMPPQRCSFVAQDVEALKSLIGNIVEMAEMKWLPTADVPFVEMARRKVDPLPIYKTPPPPIHKA